jgi:hypothetical protein
VLHAHDDFLFTARDMDRQSPVLLHPADGERELGALVEQPQEFVVDRIDPFPQVVDVVHGVQYSFTLV